MVVKNAADDAIRVAAIVERKGLEMAQSGRCPACWHPAVTHCVCARLPALRFRREFKFVVMVHWKEWFNAGDDAKLLACACPERAELFVHGRSGDDERLAAVLAPACAERRALLLFPDDSAVSIADFLESQKSFLEARATTSTARDGGGADDEDVSAPLVVCVVDATWPLARKMARTLDRLLGGALPHVGLETELVSVYARTQSQTGRVCTLEAVALLLRSLGESDDVFDTLVDYVRINNDALRHVFAKKVDLWTHGPTMGDPAWYYGVRTVNAYQVEPKAASSDAKPPASRDGDDDGKPPAPAPSGPKAASPSIARVEHISTNLAV